MRIAKLEQLIGEKYHMLFPISTYRGMIYIDDVHADYIGKLSDLIAKNMSFEGINIKPDMTGAGTFIIEIKK